MLNCMWAGKSTLYATLIFISFQFSVGFCTVINEAEPNNSYSTANPIGINDIVNGVIATNGDIYDYYRITIANTGRLKVKTQPVSFGVNYSLNIVIFAPSGTKVLASGASTATGTDTLAYSVTPGTYYVRIAANSVASNYKFISVFNVQETAENDIEPNDAASSALQLSFGVTAGGRVGYYDAARSTLDSYDFYKLTVTNTGRLKVKTQPVSSGVNYSLNIAIFAPNGTKVLASGASTATGTDTLAYSVTPGTYYVRIAANSVASNYKFISVFNVQETVENDIEPNDAASSALQLSFGVTAGGRVGYYDAARSTLDSYDFYKLTVTNTGRLKVKTQPVSSGVNYSLNIVILAPNGTKVLVSGASTATGNDTLAYSVTPGTYYVRIAANSVASNYKFISVFNVQETVENDIEPNDAASSALQLSFGVTAGGRVGYYDAAMSTLDSYDFYKLTVTNTGRLKVKTQPVSFGVNYSLNIVLFAPNGTKVLASGASTATGTDTLAYSVTPGTYYVRIAANSVASNYKFISVFNVQETVENDIEPNDAASSALQLSFGVTAGGRVGYYDAAKSTLDSYDFCKLTVTNTGRLKVKTQTVSSGVNYTLNIVLFAPNGTKALASGAITATGTDTLAYSVTPGTYFVRIAANSIASNYKFISVFSVQEIVGNDFEPNPAAAPPLQLAFDGAVISDVPTNVSPSQNSIDQSLNPVFIWNTVTGASTYRIQLSSDSNFSSTIIDDSTLTVTTRSIDPLSGSTTYYWRVNAKNADSTSAWSEVWNFTTLPSLPMPVTLLPSLTGTTFNIDSIVLIWNNQFSIIDKYCLEIYSDSLLTKCVIIDSTITDTISILKNLKNSTKNWWRVKAHNTAGWGEFSEISDFYVDIPSTAVIPPEFTCNLKDFSKNGGSISYGLPASSTVSIKLYNIQGKIIKSILHQSQGPGYYQVPIGISNLSRGYYIIIFKDDNYKIKQKLFVY